MPRAPTPDPHTLLAELVADTPCVDLSAAPPATPKQNKEEESEGENSGEETPQPTPVLQGKNLSPEQRRRDHHNTHTRRCRARLNGRFDALNRMLPVREVKHKVNILDHAIVALSEMQRENEHLKLLVALRSKRNLATWVEDIAVDGLDDALRPAVDMLCYVGKWPYAEVWERDGEGMKVRFYTVKVSGMLGGAFVELGEYGRGGCEMGGEVGRVLGGDESGRGRREELMNVARIRSGYVVPFVVEGEVRCAVALWDVRERGADDGFGEFLLGCVGNCWGARGKSE